MCPVLLEVCFFCYFLTNCRPMQTNADQCRLERHTMSQKLDAGANLPWWLFLDAGQTLQEKTDQCRLVQTSADQCRRCKKVPQDTRCSAYNASSPSSQRDHGAKQSKTMTGHQTLIARSDNGGTYVRSRLGLRRKNDEEDLRQGSC